MRRVCGGAATTSTTSADSGHGVVLRSEGSARSGASALWKQQLATRNGQPGAIVCSRCERCDQTQSALCFAAPSKWNFVIEIVSPPRTGHSGPTLTSHRTGGAEIRAGGAHIALVRCSTSSTAAGAIEHGEIPVELQHNLGRIAVLS